MEKEVERYLRYVDAVAELVIENGANEDNEVVHELLNAIDVVRKETQAPV